MRLIVPFAPGGALDLTARLLAWQLEPLLGVPVLVENRSGAGGNIGAEALTRSEPDGHSMLLASPGPLVVNPFLFQEMTYDAETEFAPVALVTTNPMAILAGPRRAERNLSHLLMTARSGERLNYSSAGPGSGGHMAMEVLKARLGLPSLLHIPFRGASPSLQALLAGQVQFAVESLASAAGFIDGEVAFPLAITTAQRWPGLPEIPTVQEEGLADFDYASWSCLVYPAAVPEESVRMMNWAVNAALRTPILRRRLLELGATPAGGTPAQLERHLAAERGKWGEAVRISGARVI
jgi:tripartite-type tricarboxylate transporter receptor subunit TctC